MYKLLCYSFLKALKLIVLDISFSHFINNRNDFLSTKILLNASKVFFHLNRKLLNRTGFILAFNRLSWNLEKEKQYFCDYVWYFLIYYKIDNTGQGLFIQREKVDYLGSQFSITIIWRSTSNEFLTLSLCTPNWRLSNKKTSLNGEYINRSRNVTKLASTNITTRSGSFYRQRRNIKWREINVVLQSNYD